MADPKIRLKRSSVEGKIPTPDQLPLGEIALNTYDGYLYASKNVGIGTTVIAINPFRVGTCLLYTSPSPRDVEESRMPSSA